MTYEKAKQLKGAGFPHKHSYMGLCLDEVGEDLCMPTLSELIEACGEKFYSIWKRDNGEWRTCSEKEGNDFIVGSTPEEAVANLWLELNKNAKS